MAIKSEIYNFLKKNIGEYLYGFEKNQLDVALLSGRIELINVNFRPDKVNELLANHGLPVHIKAGLIGKLKLKCNYMDIFSSSTEVEIDELLLIFGPISQIFKEQCLNEENDQNIQAWLNNREQEIINFSKPNSCGQFEPEDLSYLKNRKKTRKKNEAEEESSEIDPFVVFEKLKRKKLTIRDESFVDDPDKPGLLDQYLIKVLRNLTVSLKSVHISYEDESYSYENPFSLGLSIEKIVLRTTSQEFSVKEGKMVKTKSSNKTSIRELTVSNFSLYIYSMASMVIPLSLYEETISSKIGIFEAFPASEVRNLIIHQSKLLSKNHQSTVIEPINLFFCITFSEDFPNFKVVGFVESLEVKFTPAMADCLRNFLDYYNNVKIWALVAKYRPQQRIPPVPAKRERRKERKKRREIIRSWFQYAFQFTRLKSAAQKFLKERKKERDFIKRMESQAKIKEKISLKRLEMPLKEKPAPAEQGSSFASIFSLKGKRPASTGLKDMIDNLNKKTNKRPYDGEKYFRDYLVNSEIEINFPRFKLAIQDDEAKIGLEITFRDFLNKTSTLVDELNSVFLVQEFGVRLKSAEKEVDILKCGNKALKNEGIKLSFYYRPAEVLIPGDVYGTQNMYEALVEIGNFTNVYYHNLINQLFSIKENLTLNREFRLNVDLKHIEEVAKGIKKRKIAKRFGGDLKKYAAFQKIGLQLAEFQLWVEEKIVEFNSIFLSILFSAEVKVGNGEVTFCDSSKSSLISLSISPSVFSIGKNKENAYLSLFGMMIKSPSTPAGLYDFLTTLGNHLFSNMKKMQKFATYKN